MKAKIFSLVLALCFNAKPITTTNLSNPFTIKLKDISDKAFSNNLISKFNPFSNNSENNNNLQLDKRQDNLEECIEKLLPQFFKKNKQTLEQLQEGNRQAVVVIGQTGAGKSTIIGTLLGHKFALEKPESSEDDEKVLVNKNLNAPKIGHSMVTSETTFPQAYLDQASNLAFIDTAGLEDTRKNGEAINICSALGLRSLIEEVGGVQCIIGLINYYTFIEGIGSNAFVNLLTVTSSLLKNKSPETCASSMVLAFTKVPENIKKRKIITKLKKRCKDLVRITEKDQMTPEYEIQKAMYKALFPSYCGLKDKQNVPFFLIRKGDLLKQGTVRNNMLSTLQNAEKVDKKDIGLLLDPNLLDKAKDFLTRKAKPVAKDIRNKEEVDNNVAHLTEYFSFKQQQLLEKEKLLQQLTDSNSQNTKRKKEHLVNSLINTIHNNTQRIKDLGQKIKKRNIEINNKTYRMDRLNTNTIIRYRSISGHYDHKISKYNYSYNDVPIHHIIYTGDNTKDPELGQRLNGNYKIISITKNYDQGILKMVLENSLSVATYAKAVGLGGLVVGLATGGIGLVAMGSYLASSKCETPYKFDIYAKEKDIYNNQIRDLKENIENLKQNLLKIKNQKESLQKATQYNTYQLNNIMSDLWNQKELTKQTESDIETENKEIQKMQRDLQNLYKKLKPLNEKIKKNRIIPYIITQVAPFIDFHDNQQHNIDACRRYINSVQSNNQNNNNIEDVKRNNVEDNSRHNDNQPGLWLGNKHSGCQIEDTKGQGLKDNTNNKHIDNQPGHFPSNNNNIQDDDEIKEDDSSLRSGVLLTVGRGNNNNIQDEEERKEDDENNNNNNSSSYLKNSASLAFTVILARLLSKKKN